MQTQKNGTALITGAGRGFGLALVRQFLLHRWRVLPLVRREKDAETLKRLDEAYCFPVVGDVTHEQVGSAIGASVESIGTVDLLINNAGIGGDGAVLERTTPEEVLALLDVHCLGALRIVRAVMPCLKQDGTIINISSRFGSITKMAAGEFDDIECSYAYRIAKAAQKMLTQCLCREFKRTGLTICSVHPGRLKTDTASVDADKLPDEAAAILFGMLSRLKHGRFYDLFEGTIAW